MTRDDFTFLAMGFNGKKAAEFKEQYIGAFNKMEVKDELMGGRKRSFWTRFYQYNAEWAYS